MRGIVLVLVVLAVDAPNGTRVSLRAEPQSLAERFELTGFDGLGASPWIPPVRLAPGAAGELPIDGPGGYRLSVEFDNAASSDLPVTDFEPRTFVVPPAGLAPPLVVRIPAAALYQ